MTLPMVANLADSCERRALAKINTEITPYIKRHMKIINVSLETIGIINKMFRVYNYNIRERHEIFKFKLIRNLYAEQVEIVINDDPKIARITSLILLYQ